MRLVPFLLYGALVWLAAVTAAPLLVASQSPSYVLAGAVVYRAASIVCHQIPDRSFQLAGLPLAVCSRCLGLYAGAAAASVAMLLVGSGVQGPGSGVRYLSGPGSRVRLLIAAAAVPTALTWVLERGGLWEGTNAVRFGAAVPLGLAAAAIVLAAFRADRPDTID